MRARANRRAPESSVAFIRSLKEDIMGINKDQSEGRMKEAKGTVKEFVGKITGNESLETRGKVEKTLGKAQGKFGDVKQDLKAPLRRRRRRTCRTSKRSRSRTSISAACCTRRSTVSSC
jgi:uncharacterized protein YjbJ (UPF0337 family)